MRVRARGSQRSITRALFALVLVSSTMLLATNGSIRDELTSLRSHASKSLGLHSVAPSARSYLGSLSRLPVALIKGDFPADIDSLHIDLKFRNLQILQEDRLRALQEGMLVHKREVKATVRHGGHVYRAKIRLKGDLKGHWDTNDRWSLRVSLKDDATIWGMSTFSLHKPRERQYPHDQIFQELVRETGNMSPRQTFFEVTFNGDTWGVMNAEEHMSPELTELQQRKESIIAKFAELEMKWFYDSNPANRDIDRPFTWYGTGREVQPFYEKRLRKNENLRRLFSYSSTAVREYLEGKVRYEDLFDVDSYSVAFLAAAMWNNRHTLGQPNSRHYLNPYTLQFEPITTDQREGSALAEAEPVRFSFDFQHILRGLPQHYLDLLKADAFWSRFDQNFKQVLDAYGALPEISKKYLSLFPLNTPNDPQRIVDPNLAYLQEKGVSFFRELSARPAPGVARSMGYLTDPAEVEKFDGFYPRHILARHYSDGVLEIENLLLRPVTVRKVQLIQGDKITDMSIDAVVVPPATLEGTSIAIIQLPQGDLAIDQRLLVDTEVDQQQMQAEVSITVVPGLENPLLREIPVEELLEAHPFFSVQDGALHVSEGTWSLDRPLVLPRGLPLNIGPATTLKFCESCYLVVKGPVNFSGTESAPVVLQPQGEFWKGLYISRADGKSQLSHVRIISTTALEDSALILTGGFTFYESDVDLHHVEILGTRAEDALNIVNSKFTMRDVTICDTRSDGLDSDFSTGTIEASHFCNIGGDALDASGGTVHASNLTIEDVHDKAISAGERSELTVRDAMITRVGTGIVSKDGSDVEASGLVIRDPGLFAAMVYQKKSFYDRARMSLQSMDTNTESAYVAQDGSFLTVDGNSIETVAIDVDKLYESGPMKK